MSRHGRHARPVLYTYLLGEYEYDRDFVALNKDDRYLPRDRRFRDVLPFDLRENHLTRPSHLFEDVEALPLRQFAPPWVQNRYVHIALCHDPRKRPRPGCIPRRASWWRAF